MSTALLLAVAVIGIPAAQATYAAAVEGFLATMPDRLRRRARPWLWLAPALVLLAVFLVYPALTTLWLSLRGPDAHQFVGAENFRFVFTDPEMLVALRNNALWLVAFPAVTVGIGLVMAVLTDRVRYEAIAKAVLFLPMAISFVAAGVIWKFVYEFRPPGVPQIGLLNALFLQIVPGFEPVAWLVHPLANNLALIAVAAWVWTGFCLVILSAAIKAIPAELLEAARMDGAGEWQAFRRVTLPQLAPTITVVATTMVIYALKAFDVVYVMTSGNFNTEVIANRMYKELFTFQHLGRASAIAVVLLAATAPVMLANLRRFREQERLR